VAWFKMEILGGMFSSPMILAVFLCVLKDTIASKPMHVSLLGRHPSWPDLLKEHGYK
jgi:hypothetical protein